MSNISLFPYAGRSFVVNYGENLIFRNTYSADGTLVTADFLAGEMKGSSMTIPFQWRELEESNFILSWQEEDKSTVVHVDNFKSGTTMSFYTTMDGRFYQLAGTISEQMQNIHGAPDDAEQCNSVRSSSLLMVMNTLAGASAWGPQIRTVNDNRP